jgi:hypothetical protein
MGDFLPSRERTRFDLTQIIVRREHIEHHHVFLLVTIAGHRGRIVARLSRLRRKKLH